VTRFWKFYVGLLLLALIFFGRRIEWWYHEEDGFAMAVDLSSQRISNVKPSEAHAFASEVCGEPVKFGENEFFVENDKPEYWTTMPEQAISRHFTLYGLFRNTIWVGIGVKGKYCLARYAIAMRWHDCAWPFPYCNRYAWTSLDEVKLVDRIQTRPKVPPGVQALLLGECATGELAAGATANFRVEIPSFGQRVEIYAAGDNQRDAKLVVEIGKDGQQMEPKADGPYSDNPGGGTYAITIRAPSTDSKKFILHAYWGGASANCKVPAGWRDTRKLYPGQEGYAGHE
jgi:hypothetical protein